MATMTDPALICPKCGESIALTESLAAPLLAATREQYEQQLAADAKLYANEKQAIRVQQETNEQRAAELQAIAQMIWEEVQESARARHRVDEELQAERDAATQQKERIALLTQKLQIAQEAQAGLLKMQLALEDKEREFTLELQKGIAAGLAHARAKALAEAQAGLDLKMQDRDNTIAEKFAELRKDLGAERKWMTKQWAKRDRELLTVLEAIKGMYGDLQGGDLQGIAGCSLKGIDALEGPMALELTS